MRGKINDEQPTKTILISIDSDLQVGCGMLRAGVCINCAEKAAALIFESGPREDIAVEPCSGACREALQLYFSTPPERWRGQRAF